MSLGQQRVCVPTASGWSRIDKEIYKVKPRRMPRYSRVSYHQKGTRTQVSCQTTAVPIITSVTLTLVITVVQLPQRVTCLPSGSIRWQSPACMAPCLTSHTPVLVHNLAQDESVPSTDVSAPGRIAEP